MRRSGALNEGSANIVRYIDGTPPRMVAPASSPRWSASIVKRGTSTGFAPACSASITTHKPKMKVSCSGTSTTSSGLNCKSRSSTASLSASRWWPMTTPLGRPVLPEVKMTSAALRRSGRSERRRPATCLQSVDVDQITCAGGLQQGCTGRGRSVDMKRHRDGARLPYTEQRAEIGRPVADTDDDRFARRDAARAQRLLDMLSD